MNGVEILSSKTMYNTILPEYWIAVGLLLAFVFMCLTVYFYVKLHDASAILCLVLMVVSIVILCLGAISNKNSIDYIEYKVTIDNSVSMNEFLDKYEILDQEGKIYTVKERE